MASAFSARTEKCIPGFPDSQEQITTFSSQSWFEQDNSHLLSKDYPVFGGIQKSEGKCCFFHGCQDGTKGLGLRR